MPDPKTGNGNKVATPKGPSFEIYVERPKGNLLRVRVSYYDNVTPKEWLAVPICVGSANFPCGNSVADVSDQSKKLVFDIKDGWGEVQFDPSLYPKMSNVGIVLPNGKPLVKDIPPNPDTANAPPVATPGITPGEPIRLSVARHHLGSDIWELKGDVSTEDGKPSIIPVDIYPGAGRLTVPLTGGSFKTDVNVNKDIVVRVSTKRLTISLPLPVVSAPPAPAPVNPAPKTPLIQKWEKVNNNVFGVFTLLLILLFIRAIVDLLAPIEYKNTPSPDQVYEQAKRTESNPRMKMYTGETATDLGIATTDQSQKSSVDFYYRPFVDDIAPKDVIGYGLCVAALLCLGIGKISFKKVAACIIFVVLGFDQLFWTGPNAGTGFFAELLSDVFIFIGHHDQQSWFREWFFLAALVAWPILAVLCFYDEVVKMAHYHHEHKPDSKDHEYVTEMVLENGNYTVVNFIDNVRQGASASSPVQKVTHISDWQIWTRVLTVEFFVELFSKFAPIALHHMWGILKKELGLT